MSVSAGMYQFEFGSSVPLEEVELTLHLARFATEGLFGPARVQLEFGYHIDTSCRVVFVDGTTPVGTAIARVFANLLIREFGEEAFEVRRVGTRGGHMEGTEDRVMGATHSFVEPHVA